MKVTVCFGSVRVVVPCGDGDILVRDLMREAMLRYKKATGKGPGSWVSVHNLQSQGGGILDPDDRLSDVADDREHILASFEDGDGAHQHGGGDGASGGSSVGTGSPDLFHDGDRMYASSYHPRTDIEVTGERIAPGHPATALQVRRGSEPALNQLPVGPPAPPDHTKRWSAAPLILEPPPVSYVGPEWGDAREDEEEEGPGFVRRIARDGSNRLSMQFLGDGGGYRWAEAAERIHVRSLPRENKRKEPLGQANNPTPPPPSSIDDVSNNGELVVIRNEPGPLGIHVVPDYDRLGKDRGLLVQGIEPGGRIDRDGRLAIYDRIVEINGQNLLNMPFQNVQEMFKLSLTSPELRLRVVKGNGLEGLRKPPPPIYPRFPEDKENVSMVECEQKQITNTKVATVSPTKKIPGVSRNVKALQIANTRKIGRKIELELTKGLHGLGFSITTRDNPAGGNCPIYIKNIMPKGAAVEDGRLKIGDRLLEVNGVEMTGKTQAEAVAVLRNAPAGSKVRIVVSRQEDVPYAGLPRVIDAESISEKEESQVEEVASDVPPNIPPLPQGHLQRTQQSTPEKGGSVAKIISQFQETAANISNPPEKSDGNSIFPWKHREILTFNIPVHDSEKAGLGISVKGKTSGSQDLGIFIKSVIHGGAASRDKRLRTNDQLLNVNGISLLQQSNGDAMETLRKAMLHTEGLVPGNITLTVARRAPSPGPGRDASSHRASDFNTSSTENAFDDTEPSGAEENSGASSGSANTVIFNPLHAQAAANRLAPMHTWNPVLDRLTGHNKQLRNESYYRAAHDSWNASTTVNVVGTNEPILIEDEYGSRVLPHQVTRLQIPVSGSSDLSNSSLENRNEHEPDGKASVTGSTNEKSTESSQTTVCATDATYASQLSLENPAGFSRDAFGRQSMSEKRHATLDAKNTDTYQRTKKLREERDKNKPKDTNLVRLGSVESVISVNRPSERPECVDRLGQLGPSLGMKKSSSLESLQTMVQEIQMQEDGGNHGYGYRAASGPKVIRGRGCEESLRAAVAKKEYNRHLDPNHRSEISAKKHWLLDPPTETEMEAEGFSNVRGGIRQSSLNAAIDRKDKTAKKKPGLFRGIGSMFRFGKQRKMDFTSHDTQHHHYHQSDEYGDDCSLPRQQEISGQHVDANQVERLQGPQEYQQREPLYQRHGFVHRQAEQAQVIPENSIPVKYRIGGSGEYQRRDKHGKSHNQRIHHRHSHYASDDREPMYEQVNRQVVEQHQGTDYGRPGSRSGILEAVPFTHYVNYNELQTRISRKETLSDSQIVQMRLQVQQQRLKVEEESRKQHQYHSQRQTRVESDNQLRPVSNFYEYESVQAVLNTQGGRLASNGNIHVAASPTHSSVYQVSELSPSNSLPRQQGNVNSRYQPSRNYTPQYQHRGPFVTQVTIGEHVHSNGTKV